MTPHSSIRLVEMVPRCGLRNRTLAMALLLIAVAWVPSEAATHKSRAGQVSSAGGAARGVNRRTVAQLGPWPSGSIAGGGRSERPGFLPSFGMPTLAAEPNSLDFDSVMVGGTLSKSVTLHNLGGATLTLSGFRFRADGELSFDLPGPATDSLIVPPGEFRTLTVRFAPPHEGPFSDSLTADSNAPANAVWHLGLFGTGERVPTAAVGVMPLELEFGRVPVDSSRTESLTIQNVGGALLDVDSIVVSTGSGFAVEPGATILLDPDSSAAVGITFRPTTPKVYLDTLRIFSNALDSPRGVILRGVVPSRLALQSPTNRELSFIGILGGSDPTGQTVTIMNQGAEELHWSMTTGGEPWLGVVPNTGRIAANGDQQISISTHVAGLPVGADTASLTLANFDNPSELVTIAVTLEVRSFAVTATLGQEPRAGRVLTVNAAASAPAEDWELYYRRGGEAVFQRISMVPTSEMARTADIPAFAVDARGVEYYVAVTSSGVTGRDPDYPRVPARQVAVRVTNLPSPSLPPRAFRMVSIPVRPDIPTPSEVVADDLPAQSIEAWRLGRWSDASGAYREYPEELGVPFDAGSGFWVVTRDGATIDVNGLSSYPDSAETTFAITLDAKTAGTGWTQIGCPFAYPVAWSACRVRDASGTVRSVEAAADLGIIENALFDYVGTAEEHYLVVSRLEPWRGYFVNNRSGRAVTLLVPAREALTPKRDEAPKASLVSGDGAWSVRVVARSAGGSDGGVIIAASPVARDAWDSLDHQKPPSPPLSVPRLVIRGDGNAVGPPLWVDVRAPSRDVLQWDVELTFPVEEEVDLSVEVRTPLPTDYAVYLIDRDGDFAGPLVPGESRRVAPLPGSLNRGMTLLVGPHGVLEERGREAGALPASLNLLPPHPNPFQSRMTAHYQVPDDGFTRMTVIDVSGRVVRDLVAGPAIRGLHLVAWDGLDERGTAAPSGVYFLRLEHGNQNLTRKMIKLR